jgi:hypothetical protein
MSGGSLVLVDQAVPDRFSADLPGAEVGCGDAGTGISARDTLVDALMGPGGVVMLLVLGQDHVQVRPVKDQGTRVWRFIEADVSGASFSRNPLAPIRNSCLAWLEWQPDDYLPAAAWCRAGADLTSAGGHAFPHPRQPAAKTSEVFTAGHGHTRCGLRASDITTGTAGGPPTGGGAEGPGR